LYTRSDHRGGAGPLSTTSPLTAFSAGARSEPAFDWLVLVRAWSRDPSLRSRLVLLSLRILGINPNTNSFSDAARIFRPSFFIGYARAGPAGSATLTTWLRSKPHNRSWWGQRSRSPRLPGQEATEMLQQPVQPEASPVASLCSSRPKKEAVVGTGSLRTRPAESESNRV
jgi:hypothetical protein